MLFVINLIFIHKSPLRDHYPIFSNLLLFHVPPSETQIWLYLLMMMLKLVLLMCLPAEEKGGGSTDVLYVSH